MGFFDRIERVVSTGLDVLGDVAAGIGGGLLDIGQRVGGQVIEQLPGAILGGLVPRAAAPTRRGGTVFTPTGAPTTRVPEPFIAPSVSRSAFSLLPVEATMQGGNFALPGGAPVQSGLGVDIGTGLIERGFNFFFGTGEEGAPMNGMTLFRPTATSIRPARVIVVPHPQTGAPTFFGHLGRPLLFSRDLSAARRVDRLARRARRVKRGR